MLRLGWLCMLLLVPVSASAQEEEEPSADQAARTHFEAGRQYFDAGSYEDAAREFETAYQLSGRPQLLYNLFATHERLNDLDRAIDYLERYLQQPELQVPREALEQRLETLRRRAAGDEDPELDEPDEPAADAGGSLAPAIIGWSIGGAALVSFAIFAALSSSEYSELETQCMVSCDDDDKSTLRTYNTVADVSLGVGIAGVVVGTILFLVAPSGSGDEIAATAWLTPSAGGAAVWGAF